MRQLPRRIWLLIAVGVVLLVGALVGQLATPVSNTSTLPRGTTLSAAPKGSLALSQWLEAEGFGVERVREFPFTGGDLAALFVITPRIKRITEDDAADIAGYVERGGTLFLVTDGKDAVYTLLAALDLAVVSGKADTGATATPDGPTLVRPRVATIALQSDATMRPTMQADPRFLARASSENGAVVATLTRGMGRVHVVTGPYALSNAGLPEADNLALVQNLIAGLPAGARVGFDEYHHGYGLGTSIADLALRSPWGWTLLYLAGLLLVMALVQGRRFGRPLPAPPVPPKAPAEFARALGNRWREGRQRAFAQTHVAAMLKRDLAIPFGIDPAADDAAFLATLHARRPDLAATCAPLLAALHTGAKDDAAFVALVRQAEALRRDAREQQPSAATSAA